MQSISAFMGSSYTECKSPISIKTRFSWPLEIRLNLRNIPSIPYCHGSVHFGPLLVPHMIINCEMNSYFLVVLTQVTFDISTSELFKWPVHRSIPKWILKWIPMFLVGLTIHYYEWIHLCMQILPSMYSIMIEISLFPLHCHSSAIVNGPHADGWILILCRWTVGLVPLMFYGDYWP